MTTFKMGTDAIKRVISLGSQSKEMSAVTKPIFILENGKLKVNLYSERNIMNYEVDVKDYVKDTSITGDDYFSLAINEFNTTLDKVSNLEDEVEVSLDRDNNKVVIKNPSTAAKIALATYKVTTDAEVTEAKTAFATKKEDLFKSDTFSVKITPDLMANFDVAQKFIAIQSQSDNDSLAANSVCLNKDTVKYQDMMVMFKVKLPEACTDFEDDIYLQKTFIDYVRPFAKKNGLIVKFNSTKQIALIESSEYGFNSIVSLDPVRFEYPTDEEVVMFSPDASEEMKVSVKKADLIEKLKIFSGTFKSENWNMSEIELNSSKDFIDAGKIHFEHSDFTAECLNDVPVTVLNNTIPVDENGNYELKFLVSQDAVLSVLNMVNEDDVTLSFNGIGLNKPHGPGIKIETPTMFALCSKLLKAN